MTAKVGSVSYKCFWNITFASLARNGVGRGSNVVYLYTCPCKEKYIGQTKRLLRTRIKYHQYDSALTNVHLQNLSCETYKFETQKFNEENCQNYTSAKKAKFDYFQNRFKIIGRGVRNTKDR